MTFNDVRALLGPLSRRVVNMIARGVVKRVDDAKKAQLLQLGILADEVKDDVERLQNYGFTSVPLEGAEAVIVFPGGKREHAVTIIVEDRRYRIKNLESGEVAVYDSTGSTIVLKKNGDIEVTPSSGKAKLSCDVEVSGDLKVDGKADVTGDVSSGGDVKASSGDVIAGAVHLKTHTHLAGSLLDSGTSGGSVTGTTGPPS